MKNNTILKILVYLLIAKEALLKMHTFREFQTRGSDSPDNPMCPSDTKAGFVSVWFEIGTQISFPNVLDKDVHGQAKYLINDESNKPQYVLLTRGGSICYMVDSNYEGWIQVAVMLVPQNSAPNFCKITHIFTTAHLVPCNGSPTSVEELMPLVDRAPFTYEKIDLGNVSPKWDDALQPLKASKYNVGTTIVISSDFTIDDFDEDFAEILLLHIFNSKMHSYDPVFSIGGFEETRKVYKLLSRDLVDPKSFIERNIWGSLRGFHLLPDPDKKFGTFIKFSFWPEVSLSKSLIFQFYISEPYLMTEDDLYVLKFDTYRLLNPNPAQTLITYHYKLKVQRLKLSVKIRVYINEANQWGP